MIAPWFGEWDEVNGTAWQTAVVGKSSVAAALKNPDVARKLEAQGIDLVGGGPEVFKPFVEKQMTTWSAFIKANNITE